MFPLCLTHVRWWLLALLAASQAVMARVDVPLMYDSAGRYVVGMTMSPGPTEQNINFTISTSTGLTYVAGVGTSDVVLYNETSLASTTPFSNATNVPFFTGFVTATVVKESSTFTTTNGTSWTYNNQTLIVVSSSHTDVLPPVRLGVDVSGILGLGINGITASSRSLPNGSFTPSFQDSLPGQVLLDDPEMTDFTFGLALERPVMPAQFTNNSSRSFSPMPRSYQGLPAGTLHLLRANETSYMANNISWVTVNASATMNGTSSWGHSSVPESDWGMILDGWVFDSQNNELRSNGQILVDVDPLYTNVYVPQDQAELIHDAIPGARQSNLSTLGTVSRAWTVPCNSKFAFSVVIGSQTFPLNESTLVIDQELSNGACVSGIEGWTDPAETAYLFGSRFLSAVYMIFNVSRNGTQTVGFAPHSIAANPAPKSTNQPSHTHAGVGAIVGGVIGGFFLVVIVLSVAAFCYVVRHPKVSWPLYKRAPVHKRDSSSSEYKLPGHIEPFTLLAPSSVQAYRERSPPGLRRTPSPISVILSPPPTLQDPEAGRGISRAPLAYRYHHYSLDSVAADRIYQATGNISLASVSVNGSIPHTPVSTDASTLQTMATCG